MFNCTSSSTSDSRTPTKHGFAEQPGRSVLVSGEESVTLRAGVLCSANCHPRRQAPAMTRGSILFSGWWTCPELVFAPAVCSVLPSPEPRPAPSPPGLLAEVIAVSQLWLPHPRYLLLTDLQNASLLFPRSHRNASGIRLTPRSHYT